MEAAGIRLNHSGRSIRMAIVFGAVSLDSRTDPWEHLAQAIYLDKAIAELAKNDPEHFLAALFRPLLEPENKKLKNWPPATTLSSRKCSRPSPSQPPPPLR